MRNISSLSFVFVLAGFIGCSRPNDPATSAEATSDSGSALAENGAMDDPMEEMTGSNQSEAGGQNTPGSQPVKVDAGSPDAPDAAPDAAPEEATPVVQVGGWSDGDTIPSGMEGAPDIQILKVHRNGSGDPCGVGKMATLKYKAMLANGTVIDPGTRPFSFKVGAGRAIKGWDVVVSKMRVGDSFTIILPMKLAYGPSKGDLKFDMELLSVK